MRLPVLCDLLCIQELLTHIPRGLEHEITQTFLFPTLWTLPACLRGIPQAFPLPTLPA